MAPLKLKQHFGSGLPSASFAEIEHGQLTILFSLEANRYLSLLRQESSNNDRVEALL